jgi:hypothetical protein
MEVSILSNASRKEYNQKWYERNKERVLKRQKEYREKHPEEIRLKQKEYRIKNQERIRNMEKKSKEKHKERCKEYSRTYAKKLKLEVLTHYGGSPPKCACCGETIFEFLTIDHIDGGGHKERERLNRFGHNFYVWLRKNNYPKGYQVLCYNCNCGKKGNNGVCPHGQ